MPYFTDSQSHLCLLRYQGPPEGRENDVGGRNCVSLVCSVSRCSWNEMKWIWQMPISYGFLMQMRLGRHLAPLLLKGLGMSLALYLERNCNWTDYFLTHSKPFKQQDSHPAEWTWGESGCCWRKSVDSLCKKRVPLMLNAMKQLLYWWLFQLL